MQSRCSTDPAVNHAAQRACVLPLVRLCDIDDVWFHALEEADLADPAVLRFTDCFGKVD